MNSTIWEKDEEENQPINGSPNSRIPPSVSRLILLHLFNCLRGLYSTWDHFSSNMSFHLYPYVCINHRELICFGQPGGHAHPFGEKWGERRDEDVTMVFAHRAFTTWYVLVELVCAGSWEQLSFWSVAVVYLGSISQERPRVDWQLPQLNNHFLS